ncbi:EAL domain-containing protein [Granulosicoccus sp. 3-233]|uniref:EAL domain-containing protein n=1 Tax=Granulosicoccus sp. 3-233 TaxID=3417969 RepID=UPI003D34F429
MCCSFVVVVSLVTWIIVSRSQEQVIQFEALKLADIVVNQAASARSAYSSLAVSKLKADGLGASEFSADQPGHIPLPAQFLKDLSFRSQQDNNGLFSFRPISKWNLAPEHGIRNKFQEWAWEQLESQNRRAPETPLEWTPVWRISEDEQGKVLRYLTADPAASPSCVNCHNALEKRADVIAKRIASGVKPGNQWQLHELLGAIEITIPLDRVAALAREQTRDGLLIVLGITIIGVCGVCFIVFYDVARTHAATEKLAFHANHDSLTGLPNRFALESTLNELVMENEEQARGESATLVFLDLDNFKQINDTLGHETGDKVLTMGANRIAQAVAADGFVARLGGDEFAVVLPGKSVEQVNAIAGQIADSIIQPYEVEGYKLSLGVSIGAALFPENAHSTSELLRCADVAMYTAKNGPLTFAWYDPASDTNAVSNLVMKDELREAIENDTLDVHYQPKYCLNTGRMTGVEALARWHSPSAGFVPPDVFISLAEHVGLINDLTSLILNNAASQCQRWRQMGFDLTVSVNLSAMNLHDGTLPTLISNCLSTTGLPASALILEVTEGTVMTDIERACEVLSQVRSLGVTFSVDDYGAGYSSLSYLNKLPVSELKLDRAFITHVGSSEKDAVIVRATLELARNLGLTMVAEGVEDAAALDFLCSIHCDQVQGYFLCRPLPAHELERRLPYIHRFSPVALHDSGSGQASDLSSEEIPRDKAA